MTAATRNAFVKNSEFGNYAKIDSNESSNGPIAISQDDKSSKGYQFEPKGVKVTEYKTGNLNSNPVNSSRYKGSDSSEKIENVSNILGRKSS